MAIDTRAVRPRRRRSGPAAPREDRLLRAAPPAAIDRRAGKAPTRLQTVADRDDAVSLVQAGVPTREVLVPSLTVDGTGYQPHEADSPATYPVPLCSWGDPDPREAAFVALVRSEHGQSRYVENDRDLLVVGEVNGRRAGARALATLGTLTSRERQKRRG
ncbi:hypothetical protein N0B31_00375 [Salinirubellus salinus]|uniref:Uncharacterized protein n=1 Tax=Salinirubellus salinus TaxID=1364945 RepID=A0A9E7U8F7_9EURY|nr:hypothetical protein [Salinirubellus salinus]UWM54751.1 hypothetical protein N0B31_00375 [Salinirubellus salinus]